MRHPVAVSHDELLLPPSSQTDDKYGCAGIVDLGDHPIHLAEARIEVARRGVRSDDHLAAHGRIDVPA